MKVGNVYYSEETNVIFVINEIYKEDDFISFDESGFFKTVGSYNYDDLSNFKIWIKNRNYKLIGTL